MEPVNLFLLVASLLLAVWLCLPELLVLCGRPRIENGFAGGPEEDAAVACRHEVDEDLGEQLTRLGFQPKGLFWERVKFGRTFRELVFANAKEPGFAMLYPNKQIEPRRAAFLTVFTSGAVVFTKNYPGGLEAKEDDFIAGTVPAPEKPVVAPPPPGADADDFIAGTVQSPLPAPLPEKVAPPKDAPRTLYPALLHTAVVILATLFWSNSDHLDSAWIISAWIILGAGLLGVVVRWFRGPPAKPEEPVARAQLQPLTRAEPVPIAQRPRANVNAFRIPLAEVLIEHRRRVAGFLRARHVPVSGTDPDSFLEVQRLYYEHPVTCREFRAANKIILGVKLFFFALAPAIFAYNLGADHPAPWACLLCQGLALAAVRYGLSSASVLKLLGGSKVTR